MPRYFLEVSYKGTNYSGFQVQKNANTIQAEVEKALAVLQRKKIDLTGSSRTDAGVHALQNFFHFDIDGSLTSRIVYKINAILPPDIVAQKLIPMAADAHCRFDALSREYKYFIYRHKDPFLNDRAFYFPYKLNFELMHKGGELVKAYSDFTSFSKRKTQAKTFQCNVTESHWDCERNPLVFHIRANRFLRGMVRALVATMLKLGRGKITLDEFVEIIESRDNTKADFAVPAHGLFLTRINYPEAYFME